MFSAEPKQRDIKEQTFQVCKHTVVSRTIIEKEITVEGKEIGEFINGLDPADKKEFINNLLKTMLNAAKNL